MLRAPFKHLPDRAGRQPLTVMDTPMYKIIAFFLDWFLATSASAQTCPTRPTTDALNACASTQFVKTKFRLWSCRLLGRPVNGCGLIIIQQAGPKTQPSYNDLANLSTPIVGNTANRHRSMDVLNPSPVISIGRRLELERFSGPQPLSCGKRCRFSISVRLAIPTVYGNGAGDTTHSGSA